MKTRLPDAAYRVFVEAMTDGAFVVDVETGRIEWLNEAAARLQGSTREKLLGLPATDAATEGDGGDYHDGPMSLRVKRFDGGPDFPVEAASRYVQWDDRHWLIGVVRDATARARVMRELKDSAAVVESAFHRSPLLMAVSDAGAGFVEVNDTFCRVIGYTREEVLGRTSIELGFLAPEDRQKLFVESRKNGRVMGLELPFRTRAGEQRLARFWVDPLETPSGTRMVTIAEDVTERRKVESARIEVEQRLEKLAQRVPGVMFQFRLSPDGLISLPYSSEHLATLMEFSQADLAVDPGLAFSRYHPDDMPKVAAAVDAAARDLSLLTFEVRVVLPSGKSKWVACNAVPEREPDGSVLFNGVITDVTARKQAEAELASSEQRFQLAMEATSDALFDWNLATGETFTTPNYVRMLGYAPGDWVPTVQSWQSLVHPDDAPRVWAPIEACIAGLRERYEIEYRLRGKDGAWKWVLSRGKGLDRDAQGRARRLVGTQLDLREQKRLELEVAQRDRLANLGLLAAGIAHEVNNPLSWVLSNLTEMTETLQHMTGVTARVLEALGDDAAAVLGDDAALVTPQALGELVTTAEAALEGTQRIRQLSRSLGAFARAGEADLESVDVNEALELAARMSANELKFRARLERALQPVPAVRAVSGKLTQLCLNLLLHAAHAIPEGHADEHCITLRSWAEGPFVFVEVRGTSRALTQEEAAQLFEPRFSTAEGNGLGLGLAIARNLVTEFGGDVRVESGGGAGARVVVRLPAEKPVGYGPPAMTETGKGRVLVVDDEPALRRTLARTLRDYEVETAASGREVQALLQSGKDYDVVLCDVSMPEMTGPELHRWMQQHHEALAKRFVFLSGGSFSPDINDALERSGARRLDKPFEAAKLKALVDEFVAARRG